jgi:hypothetical protein
MRQLKRFLILIGLLNPPVWAGNGIFDNGFEDAGPGNFPPVTIGVVDSLAMATPCGVAIAQVAGGTFALIGAHDNNEVFSYALDLDTGGLTLAGSASSGGAGPSAIIVNGLWVIVANEDDNTVAVLELNETTGALSSAHAGVSTAPGLLPAMVEVTDSGLIVVGNRNGHLSVYQQNPDGSLLTFIAATLLGTAMEDMADGPGDTILVADPILGNAVLYRINANQTISTLDSVNLTDPLRVARTVDRAYIANFDIGGSVEVNTFNVINGNTLSPTGADPFTTDAVADLEMASDNARLVVANSTLPLFDDELTVLAPTADGVEDIGSGILGAGFSFRNVASVPGNASGVEFAVVTRFDHNETVVVRIEE